MILQDLSPRNKFQCASIQGCPLFVLPDTVPSSPFCIQTESAGVGKRNAVTVAKSGVADALAKSKRTWSCYNLLLCTMLPTSTCRACYSHRRFCWTDAFQLHWNVSHSASCTNFQFFWVIFDEFFRLEVTKAITSLKTAFPSAAIVPLLVYTMKFSNFVCCPYPVVRFWMPLWAPELPM